MKPIPNEIVLRPRFQLDLTKTKETVLGDFDNAKENSFVVKRLDEHIYIKFNATSSHFWSPQLHLEIVETDENKSKLYGVFGPNPTLWTFFMFLHFGIATLFVVLAIWAYSSAALGRPYGIQLTIMTFMIIMWFVLYFLGRAGKNKGKPQMQELYNFMIKVLS